MIYLALVDGNGGGLRVMVMVVDLEPMAGDLRHYGSDVFRGDNGGISEYGDVDFRFLYHRRWWWWCVVFTSILVKSELIMGRKKNQVRDLVFVGILISSEFCSRQREETFRRS